MFLLSKHYRVVKIKDDPAVRPLQKAELKLVEADCLKQNDGVVPGRFS